MIPVTPAFAIRVVSIARVGDYDDMCGFMQELVDTIIAFDEDDEEPQDEQGKEEDLY